jgi:hypothetical protein
MKTPLLIALLNSSAVADSLGDRADSLGDRAVALGDSRPQHARRVAEAAIRHGTKRIPPELIVAIAWNETRFIPDKRTGHVCGVMHVDPADIDRPRSDCLIWDRDVDAAVAAGVLELEIMLRDRRTHGEIRLALLYRACGNSAFDGTCKKGAYPGWILRQTSHLKEIR